MVLDALRGKGSLASLSSESVGEKFQGDEEAPVHRQILRKKLRTFMGAKVDGQL